MNKKRSLVILLVLILSLGLVTAALAAANSTQVSSSSEIEPRGLSPLSSDGQIPEKTPVEMKVPIGTLVVNPGFTVDLVNGTIWGVVNHGDVVTITRSAGGAAYGAAEADGVGFFWTRLFDGSGNGQPVGLHDGDTIEIYVNGALATTISPAGVIGRIDVLADLVTGVISNAGAGVPVTVTVGLMGITPPPGAPQASSTTDANGAFTITFDYVDLGAETLVAVDYLTGTNFMRSYLYPNDPVFQVTQFNRIVGYAPRGQSITATIYSTYPTDVRWQSVGSAFFPHGYYDIPGDQEDAQPGDVVMVQFDDGTVLSTTLANLGNLSFDTGLDQVYGNAPAGATVHLSMRQWQNNELIYTETFAIANGGGSFTATFNADLRPRDWVNVAVADAKGHQTQLLSGPPHLNARMDTTNEWDCVQSRVDGPYLPITLTIETISDVYTRENPIGPSDAGNVVGGPGACFLMWGPGWGPIDFSPGNTVTVKSPTWEGSLVLADISWQADTTNDEIIGDAPAGEVEVFVQQWHSEQYPINGSATQMALAASSYTAAFTDFDVRDGGRTEIRYFDPTSDFATRMHAWEDNMRFFEVHPPQSVGGRTPFADAIITARLYDSDGSTLLASTKNDDDDDPWNFYFDDIQGYDIEPGYWVTLTSYSYFVAAESTFSLGAADLITNLDFENSDNVTHMLVKNFNGNKNDDLDTDDDGTLDVIPWDQIVDCVALIETVGSGDQVYCTDTIGPDGPFVPGHVYTCPAGWQIGQFDPVGGDDTPGMDNGCSGPPNTSISEFRTDMPGADNDEYFELAVPYGGSLDGLTYLVIGDGAGGSGVVEAVVDLSGSSLPDTAGWVAGLQVPEITLEVDTDTDLIWGEAPKSLLYLEGGSDDSGFGVFTPVDGYALDTDFFGHDLEWGDNISAIYQSSNGNRVRHDFGFPMIIAQYDMEGSSNNVWGWGAIPGNSIVITVTDPGATVVATGTTTAGSCDWCEPHSYQLDFSDGTIVPSNTVTVDWGDGLVDSTVVVSITAHPDAATDIVTGTAPASGTLNVNAQHSWGDWIDFGGIQVNASGYYTIDFGAEGWDILLGDSFSIFYEADRGHQTLYHFWLPAPELWIEKQNTPGVATPGGTYLYAIWYSNGGSGAAENTIITDTLPLSTSYFADTSGFPVVIGAHVITWTLGDVPPDNYDQVFYVALNIDSAVPTQTEIMQNCARISTSSEGDDPEDNQSCSGGTWVDDASAGLWVDKWPEPSDPTPGQEFGYYIEYGSEGSATTGPAWLTDTLPISTTFVRWYEEHEWGALWTEVVTTGGEFALYAPAGIPGDMGGRIRLTLRLEEDVPISTTLENTVVITTAPDMDPDNNWRYNNDAHVSEARYDLSLDKSVNASVPIAGEWINYFIHIENRGNVETNVWVTETVPISLTFEEAWWGGGDQPNADDPLPDPTIIGDQLVWDLGNLEVGGMRWFHIQMNISPTLSAGEVITNCANVGGDGEEDTPDDNHACYQVTLNQPGPNLRASKWFRWEGGNDEQLHYEITAENLGTGAFEPVWITDTYPLSTTFNWDWRVDHGPWITITDDYTNGQLIFWLNRLESGETARMVLHVDLDDPDAPLHWYTNTIEIDTPSGDTNPDDNIHKVGAFSGGEVERIDMIVATDYSNMWGEAQPETGITVTTAYTQVFAWADSECGGCWDIGNAGPIWPGEVITVEAGAGLLPVVITVPDPFSATASSVIGMVWGQIDHLDNERVTVDLDGGPNQDVFTDDDGNYSATFADFPRGGSGEVRYNEIITYAWVEYHRQFQSPDLIINVDYYDDWVNGNFESGHTVWITVTESDGFTVKASAVLTTGFIPEWGGGSGFQSRGEDWIPGPGIDITPGDWVYALADNGFTTTVHVGMIDGGTDLDADIISGTIHADWFSPTLLTVSCEIHEEDSPAIEVTDVHPDGGEFYCDFSSMWDIQPEHNVAVSYIEPDNDRVQTHFRVAMPYLNISKWSDGEPGEGGNLHFYIQYNNDGDGPAEDVVITDTMEGLTYITDTLGVPRTGGGSGPIVWDLGTVEPGEGAQFDLFVEVTAPASETITNTIHIATSSPYDQGEWWEKWSRWNGHVQDNDTHLNVGKNAWTSDPAPDTEFIWAVNVCNEGNTGSSYLTLTDTLPISTTLVEWWGQQPGWTEQYRDGTQLVLSHPLIGGWQCNEVYLRLYLDSNAWPGMPISNTATITASNDFEGWDNETTNWLNVNVPHTNLSIDKWWTGGYMVPGGGTAYNIDYWNNGNVPVENFLITDTLPISTSLIGIWAYDRDWNYIGPVTPTLETYDIVVWEVGGVENGEGGYFDIQLAIDNNAIPGSILTNTAEISSLPYEDNYGDNISSWVETIYESGPNLRVTKSTEVRQWELKYWIQFANTGDETVYDVLITDTYPLSTTFNWNWSPNFGEPVTLTHNYTESQLIWEIKQLDPGSNPSIEFNVDLDNPGEILRWFTNTVEITTPPDDANPADNVYTDVAFSGGELSYVDLMVETDHSNMWGDAQDETVVTVTTAYSQVFGWADGDCGGCWNIEDAGPIWPGEVITVEAGGGLLPVVIEVPDPFTAYADSDLDMVWGQIDHLDNERVDVDLDGYPTRIAQTDGDGNYSLAFPDIPRGGRGEVVLDIMIDHASVDFHRGFQAPDLILRVNYHDDWVNGGYLADHTVYLTVTNGIGEIKATAVISTWPNGGWGGDGFETSEWHWTPSQPDIEPGDWVYGMTDDGNSTQVQIGEITGYVDSASDTITGTVDAGWWLTETLDLECHPWDTPEWAPNPRNKDDTVLPDNTDVFSCSWNPVTEWDVEPGQNIGVFYKEPTANMVGSGFNESAPYLQIWKNTNGNPGEGSNFVFQIQYQNQGNAAAEDVVITDTMEGMTYITDTLDLPHTGSGSGPIAWNLGTVQPNAWVQFDVFVEVTAVGSDTITNTVQITTSSPYDQGEWWEKFAWWSGHVQGNDTQVYVTKGAWTGDPAPGYDFVYTVDACNWGSTGSSDVLLSDTLPLSTTLVNWWANTPGWTQVISEPQRLVVSRPTVEAGHCWTVYTLVHLDEDAWSGMPVSNTATITSSNDLDPSDNQATYWAWANDPHTNLSVNKWWNWGQLVPGGQTSYSIDVWNNGNVPVDDVFITDTLPVSTSLIGIWAYDRDWNYIGPITPTQETSDLVVWEVGTIENGDGMNFELQLAIDDIASPGTILTNTVEVNRLPDEDDYGDNTAYWIETIYEHGPNLRVNKNGNWDDWSEDTRRASYWITIENIGDVSVYSFTITDTLPISMVLDGGIDSEWWRLAEWVDGGDYITATFDRLDAGESTWFSFSTIVSGTGPLPFGLIFTNTVEASLDADVYRSPDDTNPDDNTDTTILTTGPDLYVEKTLVAGDLLPGELITFSLTFGNKRYGHEWWWNMQGVASITDTLPPGLEYITSTIHWCEWGEWCGLPTNVNGDDIGWRLWPFGSGEWQEIYLTVRITDTAEGDDVYTNLVRISSSEPVSDTEPYYNNNEDSYDVVIALPKFEVDKVYESSQIAGTVVTYTLTVTNTGSEPGTNVSLVDSLPSNLTFGGSDGNYDGRDITWTFGNIPEAGGTATGWFTATLPCTGTVNNNLYRVASSDEGVNSPAGVPVIFDVRPPSISVEFTHNPGPFVAGDTVHFTAIAGTDGTPLSSEWDLGDGTTVFDSLITSHTYTWDDTFTIVFTATDTCSYNAITSTLITVNEPDILADFSPSEETVVVSTTISFTNNSSTNGPAIETWKWDFDDGITITTTWDVSHTYFTDGAYTVTLVVTDALGYSDIHTNPITVTAPVLVADFDQSAPSAVVSDTITFTDTSTTNVPPIAEWQWDFGDSSGLVFTQDASHTYLIPGTFMVTLVVTDELSYSDITTSTISVNPPTIVASFTQSADTVLVSDTVQFTNTSFTNGPPIEAWKWDFDDGTTITTTWDVSHTYLTDGAFSVMLVVTDSLGYRAIYARPLLVTAPILEADFDQSAASTVVSDTITFTDTSTTNVPPIAEWQWDFGDSSQLVFTQDASHVYLSDKVYTITLVVTDTLGYSDETTSTITVAPPTIVANFEPSTTTILISDTVQFTDTSATNVPPIVEWEWDFGDSSAQATGRNPSHQYTEEGIFTVTLVVTDALGYSDEEVKQNLITVSLGCIPLTEVNLVYEPVGPKVNMEMTFTASITPTDATIPITYTWDFGDLMTTTLTTPVVKHTYTSDGTFTAIVTASNVCTLEGVIDSQKIVIALYRVFLPLVVR